MQIHTKQWVTVDLSEEELRKASLSYLYQKFKWGKEFIIEGDTVYEWVEYATSHRYDAKEERRKASEIDKAVFLLVEEIKKFKPS
jgi:hypothetical protein